MQIPKEYLEEKNYEGTRLIEVTDPKAIELREEVSKFKPEAEPFLVEMEKYGKELDPAYEKIGDLHRKIQEIKDEIAPTKALFDEQVAQLEKIEAKAQLIKNKLQPLINKLVEAELGEFERANQLIDKDGKLFVEVVDEIEEKVKSIRASKVTKK